LQIANGTKEENIVRVEVLIEPSAVERSPLDVDERGSNINKSSGRDEVNYNI